MSTKRLIIAAVICGLVIVAAFVGQLLIAP
jgi:hypothetical protein